MFSLLSYLQPLKVNPALFIALKMQQNIFKNDDNFSKAWTDSEIIPWLWCRW